MFYYSCFSGQGAGRAGSGRLARRIPFELAPYEIV